MANETSEAPLVGVVMGSKSDWETMRHCSELLTELGIPHESKVVSAHRTPDRLFRYGREAEGRGLEVVIAGAGGAAHLPGNAGGDHDVAGAGRAGREQDAARGGFAACRSCRCLAACRSARSPSGPPGRPTRRSWRRRFWVGSIPEIREALARFRQAQTDAVGEAPA